MIKQLVFNTYDKTCERQLKMFIELFDNMLTTTFANPWIFLKGSAAGSIDSEDIQDAVMPSLDDTKERIPKEITGRTKTEATLSGWLTDIPTESHQIDEAVEKVQMLVLKTYSYIRSQVSSSGAKRGAAGRGNPGNTISRGWEASDSVICMWSQTWMISMALNHVVGSLHVSTGPDTFGGYEICVTLKMVCNGNSSYSCNNRN